MHPDAESVLEELMMIDGDDLIAELEAEVDANDHAIEDANDRDRDGYDDD